MMTKLSSVSYTHSYLHEGKEWFNKITKSKKLLRIILEGWTYLSCRQCYHVSYEIAFILGGEILNSLSISMDSLHEL